MAEMIQTPPSASTERSTFRCLGCRTRFAHDTLTNVTVETWAAHMKSIRCPKCGGKKLGLGENRTRPEDIGDRIPGTLEQRARHWKATGDTGNSSLTIYERMTGAHIMPPRLGGHPNDLADLRRCILLLEHVPEWAPRMREMVGVSPTWSRLTERWGELVASFNEESPDLDSRAPKTAALLDSILQEA